MQNRGAHEAMQFSEPEGPHWIHRYMDERDGRRHRHIAGLQRQGLLRLSNGRLPSSALIDALADRSRVNGPAHARSHARRRARRTRYLWKQGVQTVLAVGILVLVLAQLA